jgi:hypothetical protein
MYVLLHVVFRLFVGGVVLNIPVSHMIYHYPIIFLQFIGS